MSRSASVKLIHVFYGYINYTGVPDTTFDDEKKLPFLEIDIDEGKQFYLTRVDILDTFVLLEGSSLQAGIAG